MKFKEFTPEIRTGEEISQKYETLLELIRNLQAEKEPLSPADQTKNENDGVFKALQEELPKLFAEEIIF